MSKTLDTDFVWVLLFSLLTTTRLTVPAYQYSVTVYSRNLLGVFTAAVRFRTFCVVFAAAARHCSVNRSFWSGRTVWGFGSGRSSLMCVLLLNLLTTTRLTVPEYQHCVPLFAAVRSF